MSVFCLRGINGRRGQKAVIFKVYKLCRVVVYNQEQSVGDPWVILIRTRVV
jgi:hypothetical protein